MTESEPIVPGRVAPLSRADAQRWQMQTFANRVPTTKEREVRKSLALLLDLNDEASERGTHHG